MIDLPVPIGLPASVVLDLGDGRSIFVSLSRRATGVLNCGT